MIELLFDVDFRCSGGYMTQHFDRDEAADARIRNWLISPTASNAGQRETDRAIADFLRDGDMTDYVNALLPPNRHATKDDWNQARSHATMWHSINLTAQQVRDWLRAGAQPWEHDLVGSLIEQGLSATSASHQREHMNTGERTTALEIGRVTARSFLGNQLSDALDEAGIERVPIEHPHITWSRNNRHQWGTA